MAKLLLWKRRTSPGRYDNGGSHRHVGKSPIYEIIASHTTRSCAVVFTAGFAREAPSVSGKGGRGEESG